MAGLFVTEAEAAKLVGVKTERWVEIARTLEKQGLPRPDPLFENRRYWPACKAFLDGRYGLKMLSPSATDGGENWR